MLIGQVKLKERLSEEVPQFFMLVGPKGQGKKLLTKWLAFHLNCQIYIPQDLKVDSIRNIISDSMTLNEKRIYLLSEADEMTLQAQNALLKMCEEPSENAIIIMTVEHVDNVLSTIKSRAKVFHLGKYSKEELRNATEDELMLKICENFGQIERAKSLDFHKMFKTAQTVIQNISVISTANAFNIPKHFELENADLFIQMLLYIYSEMILIPSALREKAMLLEQIKVLYKYKQQLKNKSINKPNALEMLFVELREVAVI